VTRSAASGALTPLGQGGDATILARAVNAPPATARSAASGITESDAGEAVQHGSPILAPTVAMWRCRGQGHFITWRPQATVRAFDAGGHQFNDDLSAVARDIAARP